MAEGRLPTKVCCTYSDCTLVFNSEKEMKKHKTFSPDHEYCSRCDEDCEDEERLLIHKIKSENHIVCPVCGVEFHSEGGRNSHIRQNHRSAQILPCAGCKATFKTASGLMHHIESGQCAEISQVHLLQEQSKKLLIKEALNAGEGLSLPVIPARDGGDDTDTDRDDADGGVMLRIGKVPSRELVNREAMNNQPKPGEDDPTASVSAMLALKHWPTLDGKSPRGNNAAATSELMVFSDLGISSAKEKENATWKGKEPARAVPDTKLQERPFGVGTPEVGDTLRMLDRSWDASKFFNTFTGEYVCPCKKGFACLAEFEMHVLIKSRMMENRQCPGCLRFFKTTAALIAHFESPSARCSISDGHWYGQIVDELTGGLIQTAGYNEDGTIKYEARSLAIGYGTTTVGTDLTRLPQGPKY
ncbi:putative C2H2 finger domain protein [Aspergillus alliaceus]|uniref:putative C2H2 finger domain protein n=1 Tax=Petromyces alliaceus TaxID=209559 RepID=UPI0012A56EEA|nr:uncharacterized protein BDW43DRAFT_319432 [Aspergillus alliaceus]KAB8239229.1 hypothetical protein BDW43DRAFT_319432 [Aspergillus alliaceus]